MKRPFGWLQGFLLLVAGAIIGVVVALRWAAPHYLIHTIERASKGRLLIERVDFSLPFTADLFGVRALHNTSEAAVSAQKVSVTPRWGSKESRSVWIDRLEVDRPILRVSRAGDGAIAWPDVPGEAVRKSSGINLRSWRVHIAALVISNGVFEFIDQKSGMPFHGLLDHVSLIIGPVTVESKPTGGLAIIPVGQAGTSFALRGRFIGHGGASAPVYCSGWLDVAANDLQASCRLEPLALTAFEPYFSRGAAQLRVYTAMLTSASQWWSRANQFTGRVHVEVTNLSEGDFSYRGRTIVDVKRLPGGPDPRLTGEVIINGPLDDPAGWQAQFLPGDDRVQLVLDRLLERGVTTLKLGVAPHIVLLRLTPSTREARSEMEAASNAVQDALEILAGPPELPVIVEPQPEPAVPDVPLSLPEPIPNGKVAPTPPAPGSPVPIQSPGP